MKLMCGCAKVFPNALEVDENACMVRILRPGMVVLAVAFGCIGACGGGVEPGSDCAKSSDCGSLTCYCAADPVPGTCSASCTTDADCSRFGSDYTCRDFGNGVTCDKSLKICLRGGAAP
jgi:hypothetical protein